ncbi:MAG: CBS domain-containing protein [Nitrospirae bacterium]|nr:CBS domain-containing protein [Nitrospirota bacterium]
MLKISDVVQSKRSAIWSVSPRDTAYKAMEIMADKDIGALVVMDNDNVVGIISERDIARNVILDELASRKVPVAKLMTRDVYCISDDKGIEDCMKVMTTAHIRHMPVFKGKKLVGIITYGDIANALLLEQRIKIHDLENYTACTDSVLYDED